MEQSIDFKRYIRTVDNFPRDGVRFYDIAPLLGEGAVFAAVIREMAEPLRGNVTKVAGFEARGFLFASAIAATLEVGCVMLRKPGKLPDAISKVEYQLEYGTDQLEMQADSCRRHDNVALVDDVVATGGTALAGVRLIHQQGAEVTAFSSLIDIPELGGSERLREIDVPLHSIVSFGDEA